MSSLRERMPQVAALIDGLRTQWGQAVTDALVRRSMRGEGSQPLGRLYAVEIGPDGVERTFGLPWDGVLRSLVTLCGTGTPVSTLVISTEQTDPPVGSPTALAHAGNSAPVQILVDGFRNSPGIGPKRCG